MKNLDDRMISAHAAQDRMALIKLYREAADSVNDRDASCFFLTHAYIFALEAGATEAQNLHARLKAQGRES
ncbi:MAG TPA: hypothetical protein VJ906_04280 [Roseovarius sp.]|nr:hypothetical protein [Roseovarius sp.]